MLSNDIASMEIPGLLAEFLVGKGLKLNWTNKYILFSS